jgi:hypothetical protein
MMVTNSSTPFFRLLTSPIPAKGDDLRQQIFALNRGQSAEAVYPAAPDDFAAIPGSPFAYWADDRFKKLFRMQSKFETETRVARTGLNTTDDFRFVRLFWEIPESLIAITNKETMENKRWVLFSKGGRLSPYFYDLHWVLDWAKSGKEFKDFIRSKGDSPSRNVRSESIYFSPGLTWPLRASRFAPYILPGGCIFGVRGQVIVAPIESLLMLLAVTNSSIYDFLFKLSLGRFGYPEFIIGILKYLPWVEPAVYIKKELEGWALLCFEIRREGSVGNEITHVFTLPDILHVPGASLAENLQALNQAESKRQAELVAIEAKIDARVAALYGVPELPQAVVEQSWGDEEQLSDDEEDIDDESKENNIDPGLLVSDLLMWCVGVAFRPLGCA